MILHNILLNVNQVFLKVFVVSKHIFIIEDNIFIANMVCEIFKNNGFLTTQFHSGEDLLKFLSETNDIKIDLFWIDYIMLGINGLELAETLQLDNRFKDIPAVLYTQDKELPYVGNDRFNVFDAILFKNTESTEIIKVINKLIDKNNKVKT